MFTMMSCQTGKILRMNFSNIRIVLVETSHAGNIGSAARAMLNMGLNRLVLVKPKNWPSRDAISMAASALSVLDDAVVVDTLQQAIADCHVVYGTSARLRNMPVPLLSPEVCAQKVVESDQQRQVAIVFGREVSGLTNEELHLCHYHVHIPVNPEYTSLNLGAAVMVVCYELRKMALRLVELSGENPPAPVPASPQPTRQWDQEPASAEELELYLQHLEKVLIRLDFHKPQYKRPLMRRLRRLYQRIQPDKMEINILRGVLTATDQVLDGKKPTPQWLEKDE